MQTSQEQTDKRSKIVRFVQRKKKLILIGVTAIMIIVLACIVPGVIHNLVITHRVQSYLDGKTFVNINGIYTTAYAFEGNTIAKEYWCSKDNSTSGNLNEKFKYKVTGSLGSDVVQLWYKDDGKWWYAPSAKLYKDGTVEFSGWNSDGEWSLVNPENTDSIKDQVLCNHTFKESVTKAATCSSGGEILQTCSKCSYTQTQAIPALDHTYQNRICTVCGAEKQPRKEYRLEANTWYIYEDVLRIQNCVVTHSTLVNNGKGMMVTYYAVCQHCHSVAEYSKWAGPEVNYPVEKVYVCEWCNKNTIVKFKLG